MLLFQNFHMQLYTPSLEMNKKEYCQTGLINFVSFSLNLTLQIMHMSKQ